MPLLFSSLLLISCASPQQRAGTLPDYWGIVPLTFKQSVAAPSDYSTDKGRSLSIKYESSLENIYSNIRKKYTVGEIEFAPYVPHKSAGLSFMRPSESKTDDRLAALTVVASSTYFKKEQSTYSERASIIYRTYIKNLMEITLQETQMISDPDVEGLSIFVSWSTLNEEKMSPRSTAVTKRGEGFILLASKTDCKEFVTNVLSPQDFVNKAAIFGVQEGKDLGRITLTVGPNMKEIDMVDKRTVAMMWYDAGIDLNDRTPRIAIRAFDRAIEVDPTLSAAYYHRGTDYTILGMSETAIKDIEKAVETNSDIPIRLYMQAGLSALKNNPAEACDILKQAVKEGFKGVEMTKMDANFRNIRNAECYKEILLAK